VDAKIGGMSSWEDHPEGQGSFVLHGLAGLGNRAVAVTVRPLGGIFGAAAGAASDLERRALDRLIESGELERLLESTRLHTAASQVLDSEGAKRLIDTFFDSGLFEHLVDRLLETPALWDLVDNIAASPAVTAAISKQGLGFADQVGDQLRARSRQADDRLDRVARRLIRRSPKPSPPSAPSPPAPDPAA
jgi:hypothetical protein